MDIKREWDQLSEWYQSKDSRTDWLVGYPIVLEMLGNIQGKTILDYGCGNGSFSRFLVQNYPLSTVVGVDTSANAVSNAIQKTDSSLPITYHTTHSYQDLKNFSFDHVCFNFVFCTIPNFETITNICSLVYAQLPKGGRCVILDPHPDSHGKKFTSFESESPREKKRGERVHVKLFTSSIDLELDDYYLSEDDYRSALTQAGFSEIEIRAPIVGDVAAENVVLGAERTDPPFIIIQATK
ncbi:MAG: class I SAM-dependent methyltransferase [Candidatus Kerfeldbacteria bacterium]|nr:class I SAM-dependent methyltransferase [Candidatus Kerfeldbacteria bacterium]